MSSLTPEAARAAAAWLDANNLGYGAVRGALRDEADRLEAAARTPGQVLCEASQVGPWSATSLGWKAAYEKRAAAVIAHVVGPDSVIVSRKIVLDIMANDDISLAAEANFTEALA